MKFVNVAHSELAGRSDFPPTTKNLHNYRGITNRDENSLFLDHTVVVVVTSCLVVILYSINQ
ncbi:hypothetical protein [Mangrovibacterium marinum]|uniref:hypothetical protein n=1 Tax=Mangrovibacterium marinum TaxID=1639118 RepID=UPI0011B23523|nr:hypothetical protein [Mangrovibacterium marinum]